MLHAIIMAGGIGSRFWPESRQARPKQFLNVFGGATLIQNTIGRLQGLVEPERCLVVTHERYYESTRTQVPAIPPENILLEPQSRNTAPCIAYAAVHLLARDPDAVMLVLPADHVVDDVATFQRVLRAAVEKAQEPGALVTVGIKPSHPETGYGYIQFDTPADAAHEDPAVLTARGFDAFPVRTFAEKPDVATAERFLDSGDFLWNSGMFIWRADSILEAFRKYLPDAHAAFEPLREAASRNGTAPSEEGTVPQIVREAYQRSPRISVDYGVLEHADHIYVIPASFGWSDVGDWRALYDLSEKDQVGNVLEGNVIVHNASRCLVRADDRLVVLVGIHDLVVVDTDDAVLICHRESAQQVKNVVDYLQVRQLQDYT